MEQFLIVKTSAIGDVIQSFPIVDALKERFPQSTIDWVAEKQITQLLRSHPQINRVIEIDSTVWRKSFFTHRKAFCAFAKELRMIDYDVLFDLQANTKSGIITALSKARKKVGYGWRCVAEKPNYFTTNVHIPVIDKGPVSSRYLALIEGYFGRSAALRPKCLNLLLTVREESRLQELAKVGAERPRLMICFGSNWENKKLSYSTLEQFLEQIAKAVDPTFILVYGNSAEKQIAEALEKKFLSRGYAIGELSLPLWQRFMHVVDGVITMDSASLHLCATTPTPTFSLFGPSSSLVYKPLGEQHIAFQGRCPYGIQFDNRCPKLRNCQTGACLKEVTVDELFAHFQNFWDNISKPFNSTSS